MSLDALKWVPLGAILLGPCWLPILARRCRFRRRGYALNCARHREGNNLLNGWVEKAAEANSLWSEYTRAEAAVSSSLWNRGDDPSELDTLG